MESILFLIIFTISTLLCAIYYIFARHLDFSIPTILKDYSQHPMSNDGLNLLVKLSVKKVNGWNRLTMFYTLLHYLLNIWSITFSCLSIYYSINENHNFSMFASIVALISLTFNLFLRSERKWGVFRGVLAKGRIETNTFVAGYHGATDLYEYTKEYANTIIELEHSLGDSDIS